LGKGDFSMKKNTCYIAGVLAVLLIFGLLLTGCSKKDSGGSGGLGELVDMAETASDAAKALNSVSGGLQI
jgi:hypothetical protein